MADNPSKFGARIAQAVLTGTGLAPREVPEVITMLRALPPDQLTALRNGVVAAGAQMGAELRDASGRGELRRGEQGTVGDVIFMLATPAVPSTQPAAQAALNRAESRRAELTGAIEILLAGRRPRELEGPDRDQYESLAGQLAHVSQQVGLLTAYVEALSRPLPRGTGSHAAFAERVPSAMAGLVEERQAIALALERAIVDGDGAGQHKLRGRAAALDEELAGLRQLQGQLEARAQELGSAKRRLEETPVLGADMARFAAGDALQASDVARLLGSVEQRGLIDLNPAQLHETVKLLREAGAKDSRADKRGLLGLVPHAVTPGEVVDWLSAPTRQPRTIAEVEVARAKLAPRLEKAEADVAELLAGRAPEALTPGEQGRYETLQVELAYVKAESRELAAVGELLSRGVTPLPPQAWPLNPKEAAKAVGALQATLGELREQRLYCDPWEAKRKGELGARIEQVSARLETMELLAGELAKIPMNNFIDSTGVITGISFLPFVLPGVFATSAEVGVVIEPKDRLEAKRHWEPYASAGAGGSNVGVGYTISKSRTGPSSSVNPIPFVAFGYNPLIGQIISVFYPGVFSVQMSSAGAIGASFALNGFGYALFLRNPAFATVTTPVLAGVGAVVGATERVLRPVVKAAQPVTDAVANVLADVSETVGPGLEPVKRVMADVSEAVGDLVRDAGERVRARRQEDEAPERKK